MLAMPDASVLLDVWEAGEPEHAIDRALTLLCAFTGQSREVLATLGVHRRDALLMKARILAFGRTLNGVAACSDCGCEVEIELTLPIPPEKLNENGILDDGNVTFRVPNSYDLAAIAGCDDVVAAERLLRSRCVTAAQSIDEATLQTVEETLESFCDPVAITVASHCPACNAPFAPAVDIGAIFWKEISAYAWRLLDEVDAFATRYGWSEKEILAMPDARRRHYLELMP